MSWPRRLLRLVMIAAAALVVTIAVLLLVLQTPWARRQLADVVAGQAERFVQGNVSIARVGGNLWSGATLEDVAIRRAGELVIGVDRVTVRYDLLGLLGGDLSLSYVGLEHPVVHLTRGPEGFALAGLFRRRQPSTARADGSGGVAIDTLAISNGVVAIGPEPEVVGGFRVPDRIEQLNARLAIDRGGRGTTIRIEQLSFVGTAPTLVVTSAKGGLTIGGRYLVFRNLAVDMPESAFRVDGTIENYRAIGRS